ncbi:MAG: ATP-binding protein [Thermoanaerobaculales bacterium]|jgi:signal transduction histidine kinase/signal recognition particle receptor subunit beta|nr:ATP-binding protein [Thermoanaerobaculales bacterium]
MVQFDNQYRQIKVKIVYYGPALGGKTTCLKHVHRVTDPQRRTRLYSLNTASDRTLFFDLLSLNLGRIRGYRLTIQLYTVPGQVQYNATRRAVLAGADGVIFVADSQPDQLEANRQSAANLRENLEANGIDPQTLPLVLQYNKRDLADQLSIADLETALNPEARPAFPTIAISGDGVMDAFAAITESTLVSLADRLGIDTTGHAIDRLRQQTRAALEPFVSAPDPGAAIDDIEVTTPDRPSDETGPLPADVLVGEAVRANLAMTDLGARLETVSRQLDRKVRVIRAIADFGRAITHQRDPADVLRMLVRTAVAHLGVQGTAVLIVPGAGELREAVVHGVERDPLLATRAGERAVAQEIAAAGEPVLIAADLEGATVSAAQLAVEDSGFSSAVAAPMVANDRLLGLLTVYRVRGRSPLDDDDLELAVILAATAAMGYANALAFRQLEESRTGLESTVVQRTDELRTTLDEVRRLNRELEGLDRVKSELISRIASQLKTPVASLVTAVGALDRVRDAPPDTTSRFLDIIRGEAATLAELIDSVAQAAAVVGQGRAPEVRPAGLAELLRATVAPLRDLARRFEVEIKVLSPSDLTTISCDAEALATALRAVVKNAIEHTPAGGEVRIEVRRAMRAGRPWIELKVSDTGAGLAADELSRATEPFWQGAAGKRGGHRGIGLGLAIARQTVERHGGRLTLARREPAGLQASLALPQ